MKHTFRQSMTWLHTWSGLVLGWFLVLIFLCGTASYFRPEISQYARPESSTATPLDTQSALASAQAYLTEAAADAERWFITPPTERHPGNLRLFWRSASGDAHFPLIDTQGGGEIRARDTRGGDFFYRLHFDLYAIPTLWARSIVGICAMFMLVAIVTGVIAHRKIFKDFFTFRPGKPQRSWLDAHNVLGVFSLPFHLLITYTGLVTLMFTYFPWGVVHSFDSDRGAFLAALESSSPAVEVTGEPAPLTDLSEVARRAMDHWGSESIGRVTVEHPGDRGARVVVEVPDDQQITYRAQKLHFDGVSGELLETTGPSSAAVQTYGFFYGLHLGRFADTGLRWLLFFAGLGGTAMVATGLILWSRKRYSRWQSGAGPTLMYRLVDALNRTAVMGLPIAMATFFLANRLLPVDLAERQHWEERSFMIAWGLVLLISLFYSGRHAWRHLAIAAALAFASVPVVNALTTQRGLIQSASEGEWLFAGVDLALITVAVFFATMAKKLGRGGHRQ